MEQSARRNGASQMPRLKTCQTCFHAKIKCVKTQDSGLCDRCLRLSKSCVFAQSKRRVIPRTGEQRRTSILPEQSSLSQPQLWSTGRNTDEAHQALGGNAHREVPSCPFASCLLTTESAQNLLETFCLRMNGHFPFVLVPSIPIEILNREKPALCLAVLTVSSFGDAALQRTLGERFNQLVSQRMMKGKFASLELLQGLLILLAWAQYQPRPRPYSQHLSLAVSIVSDLRMDRPKNTKLWGLDAKNEYSTQDWNADEIRAVAGTYYLASSSSVLLQKSRSFWYRPYYLQRCEVLCAQSFATTDKYLPLIIQLQRIIEAMSDATTGESDSNLLPPAGLRIENLANELATVKSAIAFPLNECRILSLQVQMAELLLGQSRPGAGLFGLDKLQDDRFHYENPGEFLTWLLDSILAVKSIVNISLSLPTGDEALITNMEWITLYCGLSLAARLDIVAAHPNIVRDTKKIRQFADMAHVLRQVILRIESASKLIMDTSGENNVFFQLAKRAIFLENWYLHRLAQYASSSGASNSSTTSDYTPGLDSNMLLMNPDGNAIDSQLIAEMMAGLDADSDFGNFSFALPGSFDF